MDEPAWRLNIRWEINTQSGGFGRIQHSFDTYKTLPSLRSESGIKPRVSTSKTIASPSKDSAQVSPEAIEAPLLNKLQACVSKIPPNFESARPGDKLAGLAVGEPPGGIVVEDKSELWEIWDPILDGLL
ncbi:hypothetical protein BDP27DRAFT_1366072 [Rhodocollybia butyracea]|uniref:Uncharacterized protein n=1 Tax=Rhodocollybia butyracea TaxID=206335 RepID=A0A9P5U4G5_9AGAR|nr:hypothetical protein BDP27DRAFT_1366072 [Rhodocollybia butyracea]